MKQTTHYIEKVQSNDHPTIQQNTSNNLVRNLIPIFGRGKEAQDNSFDMKLDINLLLERVH